MGAGYESSRSADFKPERLNNAFRASGLRSLRSGGGISRLSICESKLPAADSRSIRVSKLRTGPAIQKLYSRAVGTPRDEGRRMAYGVVLPLAVRAQLRAHQPAPKMPDGQPREPEALAFDGHYTIVSIQSSASRKPQPYARKRLGSRLQKPLHRGSVMEAPESL
jgi:hypothetical protein